MQTCRAISLNTNPPSFYYLRQTNSGVVPRVVIPSYSCPLWTSPHYSYPSWNLQKRVVEPIPIPHSDAMNSTNITQFLCLLALAVSTIAFFR